MNRDLFNDSDGGERKSVKCEKPLAEKMRPENFSCFTGQKHILGEKKLFRKLVEEDSFGSLIFWGPPGSGKTTLARIISRVSGRVFNSLSAVESGIKELKEAISKAKQYASSGGGAKFVLFIDEIHRYNKTQQDALLPHVENGLVTLIGATTENPSFGVIPALRSRCRILELKALSFDDILEITKNALVDSENGLGSANIKFEGNGAEQIAHFAAGDARVALSILETCAQSAAGGVINEKLVEDVSQKANLLYDKTGQAHYDHASAFQKSLRGSDPDAAVYWMARMLSAGEDPRFVARRLIVTAAEDVGNADPTALILAVAAAEALEKIGLPEGRIPLAQAVLYVACAPKSNSAKNAVDAAIKHLQLDGTAPGVPNHLRDASYRDARKLGHGKGYEYPHDYKDHWVKQSYLPDEIKDCEFYKPSGHGREAVFEKRLKEIKNAPQLK